MVMADQLGVRQNLMAGGLKTISADDDGFDREYWLLSYEERWQVLMDFYAALRPQVRRYAQVKVSMIMVDDV